MKLRLGPLPSTQTTKLTLTLPVELKQRLEAYCELHRATYHQDTSVPALIVQMVSQFIARDRSFHRAQRAAHPSSPSRSEQTR